LVSVFFESFDLYHYDNKLNKQQSEINLLKKEIEELKQILELKAGK
jgi:HAMP domain-containing protein